MLGEAFSAQRVSLKGFRLRPGAHAVSPYVLQTQGFEIVDAPLSGGVKLSFTQDADHVVVAAELRVQRALADGVSTRVVTARALVAFLSIVGLAPDDPEVRDVWRGIAVEREGARGRWHLLAQNVNSPGGPVIRFSVQDAGHVVRACVQCGEGNLDRYAFCQQCGAPRVQPDPLELVPPPPPPPPVPEQGTPAPPSPAPAEAPSPGAGGVPQEAARYRAAESSEGPPSSRVDGPSAPVREPPFFMEPRTVPASPEQVHALADEVALEPWTERASPEQILAVARAFETEPVSPDMQPEPSLTAVPGVLHDPPTTRVSHAEVQSLTRQVLQDPPTIPVRGSTRKDVFVPVLFTPPPDDWTDPPTPTPAAPLLDHHGDAVGADADLFVDAPPEIGTVRSAATSIAHGEDALWRRTLAALPWALLGAAVTFGLVELTLRRFETLEPRLVDVLALYSWVAPSLVGLLVIWLRLPSRRVLSYVGTEGIAFCDVPFRVWPPRRPPMQVLPFEKARDLQILITHYPHVIDFAYVWRGHDGRTLLRLACKCKATPDGQRPLLPTHARYYDFCRAAERSWTLFLIEQARHSLARGARLTFPLYAPNCKALRVQEGHVVFSLRSGDVAVPASTVRQVFVKNGAVHFLQEDGEIHVPSFDIGNVTLLLLVLQHYLEIDVR